jgi:stress-induced morphogen
MSSRYALRVGSAQFAGKNMMVRLRMIYSAPKS